MKRYLEHMHSKPPHERRQHAVSIATVVTAVVAVGWLGTLGVRLASQNPVAAANNQGSDSSANETQLAGAASSGADTSTPYAPAGLEVATTTDRMTQ